MPAHILMLKFLQSPLRSEFGWTNPVLIDGERGIIAGHARVLASRKLGIAEIPTIELAYLSEAQRKAYVLADNRNAGREPAFYRAAG